MMQTDHRVPTINTTAMREQHRKRSYSNENFRKRDRHQLICVVCHAPAMGIYYYYSIYCLF
jgi:5-methylcytosine-specific restriction endonuclease McrA